ncbi:hypothetical protein WG68_08475 [Arsukibacterium ikkense]|uniref:Uncharacterized protein n=1 Tax=Arsukibacterium ikkense TaxID=336831 RepID=A0A0M2V9A3_9GAMM|nr:hypothetical protein [Arsukibacterium ikkense]KKO45743.1 hypothetical protein WG68_08475 [Arsukibacterium ikkense]
MSVSKQHEVPHQQFIFQQQQTVDLTQQERTALSLVWNDDITDEQKPARPEMDTAHCAVLGYN